MDLIKLIGRTIDAIYCSKCNTFEIMFMGKEYELKCSKCNKKREKTSISIHSIK